MFTLTCVLKHALGYLEVVPCGCHVGATSEPSWTGSATCKLFHPAPCWRFWWRGPAKITSCHGVIWHGDIGISLRHCGILCGLWRGDDVGCHDVAKFCVVWGFGVCSFWCPQQHMCVQVDILVCGLGVFARMLVLTVCMSNLTLSHVD